MELGICPAGENSKTKVYSFGGLNRTRKGSKNECSDMYNMSIDEYPCTSPCKSKSKIADAQEAMNAVCAPDATNVSAVTGITGVCDGGFYYNGELKSSTHRLFPEWEWQIEQKGNLYIINGYDKDTKKSRLYYYNVDTDKFAEGGKVMRNLILQSGTTVNGLNYLCTPQRDDYGIGSYTCTLSDGTVIENSDFWIGYKDYMTYDLSGNMTMSASENVFEAFFSVGDEMTIEGFPQISNDGQIWNIQSGGVYPQKGIGAERNNTVDIDDMPTTDSVDKNSICIARINSFGINTSAGGRACHYIYFDLYDKNGNKVNFRDLYSGGYYCSGVTLKRKMRSFDNIATHHGRIWGTTPSGNQIYASTSDDIFSFTADDIGKRYAARIPSDTPGNFTRICSYDNDIVAFKRDSITIISGTNATNYNSYVINGTGCISSESVAVTPSGVIFLSYKGFYIYDGGLLRCISTKLNKEYIKATGGYDGQSYYVSALTSDGEYEFLVYNLYYGMWHKRDDFQAIGFFRFLDGFYAADAESLYKMDARIPCDWSFTLMRSHENNLNNKGINEIWVRADLSENALFMIETAVGNSEFELHSAFGEPGLNIYRCPIRVRTGESYQVRISGSGKVVIYEIEIRKSDGGRRYKEY